MKLTILFLLLFCFLENSYSQLLSGSATSYGFIENNGQIIDQNKNQNDEVLYLLPASHRLNVQLKKTGFSYDSYEYVPDQNKTERSNSGQLFFSRLDIEFVGANPEVEVTAISSGADYLNYYTTGLTKNEAFQTHHFQKILYTNLYPGIDLIFYSNPQEDVRVKYDFIVHPGADLSQVKLKYSGFKQVQFGSESIYFSMGTGALTENIPASWWQETGEKTNVTYELISENKNEIVVGFKTQKSETNQTLVIDPEPDLHWATYYGDTLTDIGTAIITDNFGYVYATGITQSFTTLATSGIHQDTTAGGFCDVYVAKFQQNAVRLWSTYYGGTGWEESRSIIVDTLQYVTITGFTDSPDGIASDSAYLQNINAGTIDAFIAKFDDNGLRIWSTYFGGEGDDFGNGIDTDFDGFLFVTGSTVNSNSGIAGSGSFQSSSNGMSDAFVLKLDTLGFPMWSTYFGGSDADFGQAISEEVGSIFVTGKTQSADLITTVGAHQNLYGGNQDAFVASFSATGNLNWSTFFGGSESESGNDVEIFNSKIYCVGETQSTGQIADIGAWSENLSGTQDAFIVRFDTVGTKIWSTYYGKSGEETGVGISMEFDGGVYITGSTNSDSMATSDVYDSTYNGGTDVYLAKLSEFGYELWCSYYGGPDDDIATGLDVYGNTSIYLTGFTNSTDSMATWSPFFQPTFGGGDFDAFIAKFTTYISTKPNDVVCMGGSGTGSGGSGGSGFTSCQPGTSTFCEGEPILLTASGGALGTGANWNWFVDGCGEFGTLIHIGDTLLVYPAIGNYTYYLSAVGVNNATPCTTTSISVIGNPTASAIGSADTLCYGETLSLTGSGGNYYTWSGPDNFYSENQNTTVDTVASENSGNYILTVCSMGCFDTDTVSLFVLPVSDINFTIQDPVCPNDTTGNVIASVSGLTPFTYFWSPGGSTDSSAQNLTAGIYYVSITDGNGCSFTDSVEIFNPDLFITDSSSTPAFCFSSTGSATINTTGTNSPYTYLWSLTGDTNSTAQNLYPGWHPVTVTNNVGCIEKDSVYVDSLNNLLIDAIVLQDESCAGYSDGSAEILVNSGTAPYTFFWSQAGANSAITDSLSPGDHFITVVDTNGCQKTDTISIASAPQINVFLENSTNPTCGFENGFIEISATGGTGSLTYFWTPVNQSGASVSDLDSGQYFVTVSDQNNCQLTESFILIQTGIFDTEIEAENTSIHEGDSTELEVITNPSAGTYSFYWQPEIICSDCQTVSVSPSGNTYYTVYVTNEYGCADTAQIFITIIPCTDPFVPTIFSPNGDGLNDEWTIFGSCIAELNLQVFDRWGELIFTSTNQNQPWDGTFKNQSVPVGNYTYQLFLRLKDDSVISESGIITVAK